MTETEPKTEKSLPPGRGLRIALAVSVAINLAVAGIFAGALWHDGKGMGGRVAVRDLGFGPYTEALSREDRAKLRDAFLRQTPDLRQARNAMRKDLTELLSALRSEPFDADGLQAILAAQGQRMAAQLSLGQELLGDFFAKMSPEDRRAFADRLEEGLKRGGKK